MYVNATGRGGGEEWAAVDPFASLSGVVLSNSHVHGCGWAITASILGGDKEVKTGGRI